MFYEFYDIDNLVSIIKQSKRVSVFDVSYIRLCFCETNKLQNIYTFRKGSEEHLHQEMEKLTK